MVIECRRCYVNASLTGHAPFRVKQFHFYFVVSVKRFAPLKLFVNLSEYVFLHRHIFPLKQEFNAIVFEMFLFTYRPNTFKQAFSYIATKYINVIINVLVDVIRQHSVSHSRCDTVPFPYE